MPPYHVTFNITQHRAALLSSFAALYQMADLLDFSIIDGILHPSYNFTKRRLFAARDIAATQMKLLAAVMPDSTYVMSRRDDEDSDNVGYDTMLALSADIKSMYETMDAIKRRARKGQRGRMRRIARATKALVARKIKIVESKQDWTFRLAADGDAIASAKQLQSSPAATHQSSRR